MREGPFLRVEQGFLPGARDEVRAAEVHRHPVGGIRPDDVRPLAGNIEEADHRPRRHLAKAAGNRGGQRHLGRPEREVARESVRIDGPLCRGQRSPSLIGGVEQSAVGGCDGKSDIGCGQDDHVSAVEIEDAHFFALMGHRPVGELEIPLERDRRRPTIRMIDQIGRGEGLRRGRPRRDRQKTPNKSQHRPVPAEVRFHRSGLLCANPKVCQSGSSRPPAAWPRWYRTAASPGKVEGCRQWRRRTKGRRRRKIQNCTDSRRTGRCRHSGWRA